MTKQHDDLKDILSGRRDAPDPAAKKKKSPLTWFVVIVLLCLLLGGGLWMGRQFFEKGEIEVPLPAEVAKAVTDNLRLEDGRLGPVKIVDGSQRNAEAGGGNVVGTTAQEDDRPRATGLAASPEQTAEALVGAVPSVAANGRPKIYTGSDAVITVGFINDLALFLAESYWPLGTHVGAADAPFSTASISSLNQRYGIELTGFSAARPRGGKRDFFRERAMVLDYVLTPTKVNALTRLYADRFADQLAFMGRQQTRIVNGGTVQIDDAECARMLQYYAKYGRAIGAALQAYADDPEAPALLEALQKAEEANYEATVTMYDARYALELAETEGNAATMRSAAATLATAEKAYRDGMLTLQRSRELVAERMHKGNAAELDTESLVYAASWAARRGPKAVPALRSAAESANFAATVLEEKAAEMNITGGEG